MTNFRTIQDDRVRKLAETLKSNGLAASETEAINMATNMTRTEGKITENYDLKKQGAVMNTGGRPVQTRQVSSPRPMPAQEQQSVSPDVSREEEVVVQEEKPRPAPIHSNDAINQAINNVKDIYDQPQTLDLDKHFDMEKPLSEVLEEPVSQTPPIAEEQPVRQEFIPQQAAEEVSVHTPSVVETPLPPLQEEVVSQATTQQAVQQQTPVPTPQDNVAQQAVQQAPESAEKEEIIEERTREITERPPHRNINQYAESKISLADVFNANR